jgi:hypothetical protein
MQRERDIGKYGWKDGRTKMLERRKGARGRRNQRGEKRKKAS